jgi:hypothetical protein
MNLTVKTLKGGKFTVEVGESNTVAQVKEVIVSPRWILLFILSTEVLIGFLNWNYDLFN